MPRATMAQPSGRLPMAYDALEHELRTPLASLRSLAEILRDHPDLAEAERRRFLEAMISEARRLQGTLDAILEWAAERP